MPLVVICSPVHDRSLNSHARSINPTAVELLQSIAFFAIVCHINFFGCYLPCLAPRTTKVDRGLTSIGDYGQRTRRHWLEHNGGSQVTRRTNIICTLGPASSDIETIRELTAAGMAVARFNASHGTTEERRELIQRVQRVQQQTDRPLATLLDLPGPEVRTATIPEPISLPTGTTVEFVEGETATPETIGLSASIANIDVDDQILLDDGRIEAVVTDTSDRVTARITSGGDLESRSGVNVPGVDLGLPSITDADRTELDLAAELEVDFVAASFIRSARDLYKISGELEERGVTIPLVAKIERQEAVENLDEIVNAADGVMVARGDLGVECPLEEVPVVQKRIIRTCHREGVPVITATEMLDSMIHARRPTRAEASDVANAVLDGTDSVMLSGETAIGNHPVRVVETMVRIIRNVEASNEYTEVLEGLVPTAGDTRTDALARSARYLARDIGATAVVVASESGYTARKAAKYRPNIPVIAATPDAQVRRQLTLSWGIIPEQVAPVESADAVIQNAVQSGIDAGVVESGDTVVVLSGMMTATGDLDTANMLKVHVASERVASGRSVVSGFTTGPLVRVTEGSLTDIPDGAILAVDESFDDEFEGDLSAVAGIIDAHQGVTSYSAIVARELEIAMISGATVPSTIADGREVTLDAERGVVYADPLTSE